MKRHKWVCLFFFFSHPVAAQEDSRVTTANYQLAARFAPYQLNRLTYSTTLSPHWIEGGDRFWYEWETSNGKAFFLVDPARGVKTPIFDNDRIAAELTRLTKDPWDGRHLPIRGIKFVNTKENTLQSRSSRHRMKSAPRPKRTLPRKNSNRKRKAATTKRRQPRRNASTSSTTWPPEPFGSSRTGKALTTTPVGQCVTRRQDGRLCPQSQSAHDDG